MLPNPGFDTLLRREIDRLPLPPRDEWIPAKGRSHPASVTAWVLVGAVLFAAAAMGGTALREWRLPSGNAADSSATAARNPLSSLRVIDQPRTIQLPPSAVRRPDLGFNILLPSGWREADDLAPGASAMLGRVTLTARSVEQRAALVNRYTQAQAPARPIELPWDVTFTLWADDGAAVEQFARARGCASTCTVTTTVINGTTFIATVTDGVAQRHGFYVRRPQGLIELAYIIGSASDQPAGVTPETLEAIVRSVGLP